MRGRARPHAAPPPRPPSLQSPASPAHRQRRPKTQTPSPACFKANEGAETFPWVPAVIYPDPIRATAWKLPEIVVGTPVVDQQEAVHFPSAGSLILQDPATPCQSCYLTIGGQRLRSVDLGLAVADL